jgi:2-keto-3-deoxy-L-rhamnonate aldolase RhmA
MNPIGFGFENFDGIGLWRDTQNGKPIDSTGEITATDSLDGTFAGPVDLAGKLAASSEVAECVSSQWFRFSYNRTVTQDDACTLDEVNEVFADSGYDLRELVVALTQAETFLYRHQVVVEGGAP